MCWHLFSTKGSKRFSLFLCTYCFLSQHFHSVHVVLLAACLSPGSGLYNLYRGEERRGRLQFTDIALKQSFGAVPVTNTAPFIYLSLCGPGVSCLPCSLPLRVTVFDLSSLDFMTSLKFPYQSHSMYCLTLPC